MKKSNLILVGLILIYLIFTSAILITLRYKLKHNDFSVVNPGEDYPYVRRGLKKSELIILRGLTNCTIIPSDSLFVEVEKKDSNAITITQQTDTLFLTGRQGQDEIPQKIRLFLPTVQRIVAHHSTILLRGTPGQGVNSSQSYHFELIKSKLFTKPFAEDISQSMNELTVTGYDDAILDLQGPFRMNKLMVSDINQFSYGDRFGSTDIEVRYHGKALVESKGHQGVVVVTGR